MSTAAPSPNPHDVWEVLDPDLPLLGAKYSGQHVRMIAVGLGGGDLLVVSPGKPTNDARFAALAAWGTPRFLLAPNHFHNGGIALWQEKFPQATVVAHPTALARLRRQVPGVTFSDLAPLSAVLPPHIRLLIPPMAKQGEVWLSIGTPKGTIWFVTDGILNEPRLPGGPLGLVMRLIGFRAKLMTNPFFKRMFLKDKDAHKAWVCAQLDADKPVMFVPCHGDILRGADVAERLRAVTVEA